MDEIVGYDEIIGDDGGANQGPRGGRQPGDGGAVKVVQRQMTRRREFPLGFFLAGILGAAVDITKQPQVVYRPERLAVSSQPAIISNPAAVGRICDNFNIVRVDIGQQSQLVVQGELDGSCFSPDAVGVRLMCQTATNGWTITLNVRNKDAVNALDFGGVFFGTCFVPG